MNEKHTLTVTVTDDGGEELSCRINGIASNIMFAGLLAQTAEIAVENGMMTKANILRMLTELLPDEEDATTCDA